MEPAVEILVKTHNDVCYKQFENSLQAKTASSLSLLLSFYFKVTLYFFPQTMHSLKSGCNVWCVHLTVNAVAQDTVLQATSSNKNGINGKQHCFIRFLSKM